MGSISKGNKKIGRSKIKCKQYRIVHRREKNLRKRVLKESKKFAITLKHYIAKLKHKPRGLTADGDVVYD